MAQLYNTKLGRDDERIAEAILSKFSFIAKPSLNPDDFGIDFFCTLFNIKDGQCFPKNTFGIQIKGNDSTIDITDKLKMFSEFELPYYVGVVDRIKCKLNIYSGEYLNHFISLNGIELNKKKVKISLLKKPKSKNFRDPLYWHRFSRKNNTYYIHFYKIVDFDLISYKDDDLQILLNNIKITQRNISRRIVGEYLYEVDLNIIKKLGMDVNPSNEKFVMIYAGSGSVKLFMENLYFRIAEAFPNIEWCLKKITEYPDYVPYDKSKTLINIFKILKSTIKELKDIDLNNDNQYSIKLANNRINELEEYLANYEKNFNH